MSMDVKVNDASHRGSKVGETPTPVPHGLLASLGHAVLQLLLPASFWVTTTRQVTWGSGQKSEASCSSSTYRFHKVMFVAVLLELTVVWLLT